MHGVSMDCLIPFKMNRHHSLISVREVSGTLNIAAVAGAYEINGVNNPTLVVRRGQTYTFNLNIAGHPFYLQTKGGGYQSANVYSNGFTGNSQTTGEHQWVVLRRMLRTRFSISVNSTQ